MRASAPPSGTFASRPLNADRPPLTSRIHASEQNNRDFTTPQVYTTRRYSRCLQDREVRASILGTTSGPCEAVKNIDADHKQPVQTPFTTRSPRRSPLANSTKRTLPSRPSSKPVRPHISYTPRPATPASLLLSLVRHHLNQEEAALQSNTMLTVHRQEGPRGDGWQGQGQGPHEHRAAGHQEVRQEISGSPFEKVE